MLFPWRDNYTFKSIEYLSPNRRFMLLATPQPTATPHLTLFDGMRLVWERSSPLKVMATDAFVSDDGRSVVLCNSQYTQQKRKDFVIPPLLRGDDKVLALLGPAGRVRRIYGLNDTLTPEEIGHYQRQLDEPIRSIREIGKTWCDRFVFRPQYSQFGFFMDDEVRLFDLVTGAKIVGAASLSQRVKNEQATAIRARLPKMSASERGFILPSLAFYEGQKALPLILKLLDDKTATRVQVSEHPSLPDGDYTEYPVQILAAVALISLLRKDALPYLKKKQASATPYMRQQWDMWIEGLAHKNPFQ